MTKNDDVVNLNFKLPSSLREKFNEICKEKGFNRSEIMRQMIEIFIKKYQEK